MSDNGQPASLAEALAALQTKLPEIRKSKRADVETKTGSFSYTYANLSGISAKIMPLLGGLGLAFLAKPTFAGEKFVLAYSLMHVSGEREDGEYPLPTQGTPQAIGSAITYGRRYCLCAVTGVAPEDDDDDAAAAQEQAAKKGTAQRATTRRAAADDTRRRNTQDGDARAASAGKPRGAQPPPLPTDPPAQDADDTKPDGDAVTEAQLRKIHVLFGEVGWRDKADRMRAASTITGRQLTTSKELTRKDAHELIDTLEEVAKRDDPATALEDLVTAAEQAMVAQDADDAEGLQKEVEAGE